MKNVSAVKVVSPIYGLEEGDVLSRAIAGGNFQFKADHIGESFSFSNTLELSEDMINNESFSPVSFFKTKKEFIKNLQKENELLKAENKELLEIKEKADRLAKLLDAKYNVYDNMSDSINRDYMMGVLSEEDEYDAAVSLSVFKNLMSLVEELRA